MNKHDTNRPDRHLTHHTNKIRETKIGTANVGGDNNSVDSQMR